MVDLEMDYSNKCEHLSFIENENHLKQVNRFNIIILLQSFLKDFWFQHSLATTLKETTNLQNLIRHKENDLIIKNQKINELESIIK